MNRYRTVSLPRDYGKWCTYVLILLTPGSSRQSVALLKGEAHVSRMPNQRSADARRRDFDGRYRRHLGEETDAAEKRGKGENIEFE